MKILSAYVAAAVLGFAALQVSTAAPAEARSVTVCGYRGCITRYAPRPRRVVVYRPRRVYVAPYPPAYVVRRPVIVAPY